MRAIKLAFQSCGIVAQSGQIFATAIFVMLFVDFFANPKLFKREARGATVFSYQLHGIPLRCRRPIHLRRARWLLHQFCKICCVFQPKVLRPRVKADQKFAESGLTPAQKKAKAGQKKSQSRARNWARSGPNWPKKRVPLRAKKRAKQKQAEARQSWPKGAKAGQKSSPKQPKQAKSSPKTGQIGAAVLQERKTSPSGSVPVFVSPACRRGALLQERGAVLQEKAKKGFAAGRKRGKPAIENQSCRMVHRMSSEWRTELTGQKKKKRFADDI